MSIYVFMLVFVLAVVFTFFRYRNQKFNAGLRIVGSSASEYPHILMLNGKRIFYSGVHLCLVGFGEGVAFFRSWDEYATGDAGSVDSVIKVNTSTGEISYVIPERTNEGLHTAVEEFFIRAEKGEFGEILYGVFTAFENPTAQSILFRRWKIADRVVVSCNSTKLLRIRGNSLYLTTTFHDKDDGWFREVIDINVSCGSIQQARKSWFSGVSRDPYARMWLLQDGGYDA